MELRQHQKDLQVAVEINANPMRLDLNDLHVNRARELGVPVAINTDASVRKIKGNIEGPARPLTPARQRAELVAALASVDWVVLFSAATPLKLIESLRPDVLAKGGDWALDEIVGRREVESWGGRVVRLREIPGVRTSSLIDGVRG